MIAIWAIRPAIATRMESTGIQDGGCWRERAGGGTRTLAIPSGSSTSASATLANSRPSCARTFWVSSHAVEMDSFDIAFPLIGRRYAGPGAFAQRRLLLEGPLAIWTA